MPSNNSKVMRDQRKLHATLRAAEPVTPEQQIAALDARLGAGVGATKERARLAKALA